MPTLDIYTFASPLPDFTASVSGKLAPVHSASATHTDVWPRVSYHREERDPRREFRRDPPPAASVRLLAHLLSAFHDRRSRTNLWSLSLEFVKNYVVKRRWKKWLLIHSTIIVGVAFIALVIWKLTLGKKASSSTQLVSNGTALFLPTTLIISLDGFRADFLNRGLTPRLNAFIKEGVSPLYMTPSFPSVTFPVGFSYHSSLPVLIH